MISAFFNRFMAKASSEVTILNFTHCHLLFVSASGSSYLPDQVDLITGTSPCRARSSSSAKGRRQVLSPDGLRLLSRVDSSGPVYPEVPPPRLVRPLPLHTLFGLNSHEPSGQYGPSTVLAPGVYLVFRRGAG